jgi:Ala-tRNA(Pro) deacylase
MAIPASISSFLDRNHIRYSRVSHPIAYTAQEEAAAAHVPGRAWAKAVVCMADGQPMLAVLPAPAKIDLERLKRAVHARSLRLAREDEFEGLYSDCELGAMPPLGPLYRQPVYVDQTLTTSPEIAFSAGSHRDAIRMRYREFQRLVRPTVAEFGTDLRSMAIAAGSADVRTSDPVCGRRLEPEHAWGRSEHEEDTYYFCSQHCKMEFDDNPQAYARMD